EGSRPLSPRALSAAQRRAFEAEAVYLDQIGQREDVVVRREEYTQALRAAVSAYQISQPQFRHLIALRDESGMSAGQVRAVHAKIFASVLSEFLTDSVLDEDERQRLLLLNECLSQLGWAPGQ